MKNLKNVVSKALSSVRRWRWKKSAARYFDRQPEEGLTVAERDTMPPETATDKLCAPGRMTNPDRKMFSEARQRILVPAHRRKPFGTTLLRRCESRPLATLGKWLRRSTKRRRGLQVKYQSLANIDGDQAEKLRKILDQRAAALDLSIEVIELVIGWRNGIATGSVLKPEQVGILRNPLSGQQLIWTENLDTKALGPGERVRKTEFPRWVPLKVK